MGETLARELIDTQNQLGEDDTITPVFGLFSQNIGIESTELVATKRSIGHAFTVGHPINGVIGTNNGVDGSQITIGVGGLGSSSLVASLTE